VHLAAIHRSFEGFLRGRGLKLTTQRRRCLDRAFATHEHFSAERLYLWLKEETGASVSRATVYRTLSLLVEGGFLATIERGHGQTLYEHILGHSHHDHMVCVTCGRILEFRSEEIERLQDEVAARHHFRLLRHTLRLEGECSRCVTQPAQPETKAPAASNADATGAE
jgi:Fur family ferric uptake transcriptional regulator